MNGSPSGKLGKINETAFAKGYKPEITWHLHQCTVSHWQHLRKEVTLPSILDRS